MIQRGLSICANIMKYRSLLAIIEQIFYSLREERKIVISNQSRKSKGMTTPTPSPNYRTGKICYIEIPASDISESAQFYQQVFGWHIRHRSDGSTAFDDTIGEVSGTWVLERPPMTDPGLLVFIMVASAATTIEAIIAAGGTIVQPVDPEEQEVYAHFHDPAGNLLGIYQQAGLSEIEA